MKIKNLIIKIWNDKVGSNILAYFLILLILWLINDFSNIVPINIGFLNRETVLVNYNFSLYEIILIVLFLISLLMFGYKLAQFKAIKSKSIMKKPLFINVKGVSWKSNSYGKVESVPYCKKHKLKLHVKSHYSSKPGRTNKKYYKFYCSECQTDVADLMDTEYEFAHSDATNRAEAKIFH